MSVNIFFVVLALATTWHIDGAGTGKCQQVWCPVCALAAVVSGDEHPLLTVVAEHSVALLAVIRAIVDQVDPRPTSRYQPISVTVDE